MLRALTWPAASVIQPQAPSPCAQTATPERVLPVAVNAGSAPTWHWMDGWVAWPGLWFEHGMAMCGHRDDTVRQYHHRLPQTAQPAATDEYRLACRSSTRR